MGSAPDAVESIGDAIRLIHKAAAKAAKQGFLITGSIFVTRPRALKNSEAEFFVAPDGRMGALRFLPPKVAGVSDRVAEAAAAALSPHQSPAPIAAFSQEVAGIPASPTGNVCATCGSSDLRRSGTCETCNSCGSTTGCG